ncbi:hypothetical protein BKI52_39140 [marine bacterium AO1-C]|nr:hypothetical protein BKI52_39140 [marine bacterium AO1-C]
MIESFNDKMMHLQRVTTCCAFILLFLLGYTSKSKAQSIRELSREASQAFEKGNYSRATQIFEKVRKKARRKWGKNHPYYASTLNSLATLYQVQQDYQRAESFFKQSIRILQSVQPQSFGEYLNAHHFLAGVYFHQKKYDQAIPLYEKVIQLSKSNPAIVGTRSRKNRFYGALEPLCLTPDQVSQFSLNRAYPDYVTALHNLAYVYWTQKQFTKAAPLYQQMLEILHQTLRYNSIFLSEREKKQYLDRNAFYFSNYQRFVLAYVQKDATQKGLLIDLLNLQLTLKAQLLSQQRKMLHILNNTQDARLTAKLNEYNTLKFAIQNEVNNAKLQISDTHKTLKNKIQQIKQLEKELSLAVGITAFSESMGDFKSIQQILKPKEAAIDIIRLITDEQPKPDTLYVGLVITPKADYPHVIILNNGSNLETRNAHYYQQTIAFKRNDRYSYKAYWQPFAQYLRAKNVRKVFLASDGVYHQLNLNTLLNPNSGQYLGQEITLHLVTNLREIITQPKNKPTKSSQNHIVRLFGRPNYRLPIEQLRQQEVAFHLTKNQQRLVYSNYSAMGTPVAKNLYRKRTKHTTWEDLPGTQKEVEKIRDILRNYSKYHAILHIGDQAQEVIIKNTKAPKILHIATHGFFVPAYEEITRIDDNNQIQKIRKKRSNAEPLLRAGLVLAGAESVQKSNDKLVTEDGILTAYEVAALNLQNTDLVVLSACDTGLGQIENREGVYGLQRAFLVAGAKTIMMSLWKVDDQATQMLMTRFYKEWIQKKRSKRKALKAAREYLRNYKDKSGNRPYASPYYWGAFVMVGE